MRFKPEPGVAPGHSGGFPWKRDTFVEFLLAIPYFEQRVSTTLHGSTLLPTLGALNELLSSGVVDAGMSGGCRWNPFEIEQSEYELLCEELLTDPRFGFVLPDE